MSRPAAAFHVMVMVVEKAGPRLRKAPPCRFDFRRMKVDGWRPFVNLDKYLAFDVNIAPVIMKTLCAARSSVKLRRQRTVFPLSISPTERNARQGHAKQRGDSAYLIYDKYAMPASVPEGPTRPR